jgi:hypothetical protein
VKKICLAIGLLFSCLYAEQYDATISSSQVWTNLDGNERQYIFVLSDGMRWMTNSRETYDKVSQSGWEIGDHLTIWLNPDGWQAKNHERLTSIPLVQLCNKGLH